MSVYVKYIVTWHAKGLGRETRKTFRSWRNAVTWWAYLRVRQQYESRISSEDQDVKPRWPTRRLRALVRGELAIQVEICRLQDAAIERAFTARDGR